MECVEERQEPFSKRSIGDVPEEILELIFGNLSPYGDMKSVMLVCKQWHRVVTDLIVKMQRNFHQMLRSSHMTWSHISNEHPPTITDRFSHSACYFQESMYVFGGCTATSTTFNDLWRFDLSTRQWARPVASGSYPSPKACAAMVVYKDSLVLYGGWSRPTPMPLHQAPRYFSEIHTYTPSTNRWSQIMVVCSDVLHRVAGHSASIIGDTMVVFGGSHETGTGCNQVWVFDFVETVWRMPNITGKKPNPRYGQSQKTLDDEHIMIIGGCGGPNQMFSDVWVLHLTGDTGSWEEITVENPEFSPPALWCHPPCMMDSLAVFVSKNSRVKGSTPESHVIQHNRMWLPQPQLNAAHQAPLPGAAVPNGAVPHQPHIPPPPAVLPMAAFQRRRDEWGGVGLGMLGGMVVVPPPPRALLDIVHHPNFHGGHNPNIQDVQRLNLRSGAGAVAGTLRGGGGAGGVVGGGRGAAMGGPQLPTPPRPGPSHHSNPPSSTHTGSQAFAHRDAVDSRPGDASTSDADRPGPGGSSGSSAESPHSTRPENLPGLRSHAQHLGSHPHSRTGGLNFSPMDSDDSDSDPNLDRDPGGGLVGGGGLGAGGAQAPRPGLPSVRPNAMHNRQRQLDMLRKHEDRLRSRNSNNSQHRGKGGEVGLPRNPMVIHVLDFSRVLAPDPVAAWLPIKDTVTPGAPEETVFFSLVEGRGELVMFGGMQRDQNPMQRANSPPNASSHSVSNGLYIIGPKWLKRL